jgi:hypothetical protein
MFGTLFRPSAWVNPVSPSSDSGYGYGHPSTAKSRLDAFTVEPIADGLKSRTGTSHRLDAISYFGFAR